MNEYIENEIPSRQRLEETRIFIKDRNYKYIYCNSVFAEDLGMTREDVIGKNDFLLYPKAMAEKHYYDDAHIFQNGRFHDCHEAYLLGGKMYWVNTVKVPINDKDGVMFGILGLISVAIKIHSEERGNVSLTSYPYKDLLNSGEFRKHLSEEDLDEIIHFSSTNLAEQKKTFNGIVDAILFCQAV